MSAVKTVPDAEVFGGDKKPRRSRMGRMKAVLIGLVIAALYLWSFGTLEIDWERLWAGIPQAWAILERMFLETDWSYLPDASRAMLESIFIAYAGTFLATFLAVPFGFLASSNLGAPRVASVGKLVLSWVRTFPEILLAVVFIAAIGVGPFAGVMAIAIHSIGMLGKLYAESIESIDMEVLEALEASGANRVQVFFYGVVPQVLPEFASYAIYRFEIDVRSSTILGLVGAGGIGTPLLLYAAGREWETVGTILIVIVVSVLVIDQISARVRSRLV
ncbi:MAG: phosphonate ABC transporter, permease protein PhnE [Rubrobacteraceae bacterium]